MFRVSVERWKPARFYSRGAVAFKGGIVVVAGAVALVGGAVLAGGGAVGPEGGSAAGREADVSVGSPPQPASITIRRTVVPPVKMRRASMESPQEKGERIALP